MYVAPPRRYAPLATPPPMMPPSGAPYYHTPTRPHPQYTSGPEDFWRPPSPPQSVASFSAPTVIPSDSISQIGFGPSRHHHRHHHNDSNRYASSRPSNEDAPRLTENNLLVHNTVPQALYHGPPAVECGTRSHEDRPSRSTHRNQRDTDQREYRRSSIGAARRAMAKAVWGSSRANSSSPTTRMSSHLESPRTNNSPKRSSSVASSSRRSKATDSRSHFSSKISTAVPRAGSRTPSRAASPAPSSSRHYRHQDSLVSYPIEVKAPTSIEQAEIDVVEVEVERDEDDEPGYHIRTTHRYPVHGS